MGTTYLFQCRGCGYRAEVAGGRDYGRMAVFETSVCARCKRLVDVYVGTPEGQGPLPDPDAADEIGRCPRCESGRVTPWGEDHPCPRCGAEMKRGETTALWD
jgi:DNA-directed RNA polymerase subunit RPC12/RpoP